MQANGVRWPLLSPLLGLMLLLGGCGHLQPSTEPVPATDEEINVTPVSYKSDILGAMHAYLNDPTGIRDSAISTPVVKPVGNGKRYVVCVRFNAKKSGAGYAGVKEIAAVFVAGRFDRFVEATHEECADASYTPFPELAKLSR